MRKKNILRIVLLTALFLLVPLIAMQFTSEVNWTLFDFVFAAVMFLSAGLAYEFLATRQGTIAYKAGAALAIVGAFLLIWITGAVGIIGSEDHPANMLYFGVIATLILSVIASGLRPERMAYALFATALVQLAVPVLALIIWNPPFDPGIAAVFGLNAGFAVIFAASGFLFQNSATSKTETV